MSIHLTQNLTGNSNKKLIFFYKHFLLIIKVLTLAKDFVSIGEL